MSAKKIQINIKSIPYLNTYISKFELKISDCLICFLLKNSISTSNHYKDPKAITSCLTCTPGSRAQPLNIIITPKLGIFRGVTNWRYRGMDVQDEGRSSCCIGKWGNYRRFLRLEQKDWSPWLSKKAVICHHGLYL